MNPAPAPDRRRLAGVALGVTFAIQTVATYAWNATSVLAPAIAADLGVPARHVGSFISIVYVGMVAASLVAGGWIARFGAIRSSQASLALCALGVLAVAATGSDSVALAGIGAVAFGLGYGQVTPASSHLLAHTAPASRRNLVFSIKQTGVPAGAAIAGATLPAIALVVGWRGAFVVAAAILVAMAALAQRVRAAFDTDRRPDAPVSLANAVDGVGRVLRNRRLAGLALVGFAYASTQVCLMAFLVVHLTQTYGWSLVAAGLALSTATLAAVAGRVGWGTLADRTGSPDAVLGVIGVVAAACATTLWLAPTTWPAWAIHGVAAGFGATAIGWNGVQLAELARNAPAGEAGAVTGAAGVISFTGVIIAPFAFGVIAGTDGGTRAGFASIAVVSGLAGVALLVSHRRADTARAASRSNR
ncbi:MAG: MFS transporter [Burkholderiales bacterium]